jgi:Uma2 family endonuclease
MSATSVPDTLADLLRSLGDVPPNRVLWTPRPGTATEADLLRFHTSNPKRRVELVNGTLVEKPMGTRESYLAFSLIGFLFVYQRTHNLGVFGAPDAIMRLAAGTVRLPDIHFTR